MAEQEAVARVVNRLESEGVNLRQPHCKPIKGTDHPIWELRVSAGASPIRMFYAFDPRRAAIILLGGSKAGDPGFYDRMVPRAEKIWLQYLAEIREEGLI